MLNNKGVLRAAVLCLLALSMLVCLPGASAGTGSSTLVISQAYGGGGNNGSVYKNDFIEIFNRGTDPVSLAGYSVQYTSAAGTGNWSVTNLTNVTLQPGQYYLIQEAAGTGGTTALPTPDATGSITMGYNGFKVALVNNQTQLSGACPTTGVIDMVGASSSATCFEGAYAPAPSNSNAVLRADGGCTDTDNNAADFTAGLAAPRNRSTALHVCGAPPPPPTPTDLLATAAATPASVDQGSTTLLTVAVTPGTIPTSTGITVSTDLSAIGGSASQSFYDDGTNGDATAGDGTFSYRATVPAATTVGAKSMAVSVRDTQNRSASATISLTVTPPPTYYAIHDIRANSATLMGLRVGTTGVVTGLRSNGFYIQEKTGTTGGTFDGPNSLAIYIFTNSKPTVSIGDEVDVTGKVQTYPVGVTPTELEIATPVINSTLSRGVQLPTPIDITPDTTLSQYAQFEKYAGMLAKVAGTTVVGPTVSGAFYAAQSTRPRPFREPGVDVTLTLPDGAGANVARYDGNPEVLRVDMSGCSSSNQAALADDDNSGDLVGPLGYYYSTTYGGSYSLFTCLSGTTTRTAVPLSDRANDQFTVASFNMLNFTGATTQTAKAVLEIRDILKMPDVIGVEEVLDEASLQLVADGLNKTNPSPNYSVKMGVISGKQNIGFLYRSDRVTNPVFTPLGNANKMTDTCTNFTIWDRQPFEMDATLKTHQGRDFPVTIIVNHLRSLIDVESSNNDGKCARWKRQIEAEQLAQILSSLQQSGKNIITLGDFNAFDFNDGYVDVMGTIIGAPAPDDQVTLPTTDYVDPNLTDLIVSWPDKQIYTYVENGSAQSIDHIIANDALLARPYHVEVAHVNADFPTSFSSDASRPERVSDHDQPVAYFTFPTYPEAATLTAPTAGTVLSGDSATFTWTAGTLVDHYMLFVGTSVGADDVYYSGAVTDTSATVNGLRSTDGKIYVRVYSWVPSLNGWQYNDYVFDYNAAQKATLTSPVGSLNGTSATFTWTTGTDVTKYMLFVGTAPATADDYYSGEVTTTSVTVNGLRSTDGNIYVRLYSWYENGWHFNDYVLTHTPPVTPVAATLTAPVAIGGTTAEFTWTAGTAIDHYMLCVGTQPGGTDNYYSGPTTSTDIVVDGMRTIDGNIYVRLYSWATDHWLWKDYVFQKQ